MSVDSVYVRFVKTISSKRKFKEIYKYHTVNDEGSSALTHHSHSRSRKTSPTQARPAKLHLPHQVIPVLSSNSIQFKVNKTKQFDQNNQFALPKLNASQTLKYPVRPLRSSNFKSNSFHREAEDATEDDFEP